MHIFIDESGIFSPTNNPSQWSSVGALIVPDESLLVIEQLLNDLKASYNVSPESEFKKNRPDCGSAAFIRFIYGLKKHNCCIHILSTTGNTTEKDSILQYKEIFKNAIANYCNKSATNPDIKTQVFTLIDKLSLQQFSQCILQSYMLKELIYRILFLYAQKSPKSLEKFHFITDRKDTSITHYENLFKYVYSGISLASIVREPPPLIIAKKSNYSFFLSSYGEKNEESQEIIKKNENLFEHPYPVPAEILYPINIGKILMENFQFSDSKKVVGLQVADLLISSVNRCLKQNFTNNRKMASHLGSLMTTPPTLDDFCISIKGFSETSSINEETSILIKIMNSHAIQVFSPKFRANYSRLIS